MERVVGFIFYLMGNNICCEESRAEAGPIEKQEQAALELHKVKEENPPPVEVELPKEEPKPQEIHQEPPQPVEEVPPEVLPEPIELPQLPQPVNDTIHKHNLSIDQRFENRVTHTRKYGDDVYVGELDEEKVRPNGLGKMYKDNGGIYLGEFKNGAAHGKGAFVFADGSFYKGDFEHNRAESIDGEYQSATLKYNGDFKNNTFDGQGREKSQQHEFEGTYKKGLKVSGTLQWNVGLDEYIYTGSFNDKNQFHGQGKLIEPKGEYTGEFVNGQKEGKGYYKAKNGTKYKGDYKNNARNGFGIIYNNDDTISYEGGIKDNLPHGKGTTYNAAGKGVEVTWNEGIDASLIA